MLNLRINISSSWGNSCVIGNNFHTCLPNLSSLQTEPSGLCSSNQINVWGAAQHQCPTVQLLSFNPSPSLHWTLWTPSVSSAFHAASRSSSRPVPDRSCTANTGRTEKPRGQVWQITGGFEDRSAGKSNLPQHYLWLSCRGSRHSGGISAQLGPAHRDQAIHYHYFYSADCSCITHYQHWR